MTTTRTAYWITVAAWVLAMTLNIAWAYTYKGPPEKMLFSFLLLVLAGVALAEHAERNP